MELNQVSVNCVDFNRVKRHNLSAAIGDLSFVITFLAFYILSWWPRKVFARYVLDIALVANNL